MNGKELADRELFFYRAYANCGRIVGDGLAWRLLGYDRALMRALAEAPTKPHVLSPGTIEEVKQWASEFHSGDGVPILNSLTNGLAIGDLTVVHPDQSVEIVEVKASNSKSGRGVRQRQAMSELITVLNEGRANIPDRQVQIEILDIKPESRLKQLEELLLAAGKRGWAAERIGACCFVEAFDVTAIEDMESAMEQVDRARNSVRSWQPDDDVHQSSSLDLLTYSPNCAPFSIFPFSPRLCVEVMVGKKFFYSSLNVSQLCRELENGGWKVRETPKQIFDRQGVEGLGQGVLVVAKGNFVVSIPPSYMLRLQMEMLKPSTLIEELEWQRSKKQTGDEHFSFAIYSGEHRLWV